MQRRERADRGPFRQPRRLRPWRRRRVVLRLSQPLGWANTSLVAGDAVQTLPAVKRDSDVPMRTMGSISLVQNLVAAGLVDRLLVMVFRLTCGIAGGDRIFGEGKLERFELEDTRILDARVVLLEYRTVK
jgi:dihydrofolate reductase